MGKAKMQIKCECESVTFKLYVELDGNYGKEKLVCDGCQKVIFESFGDADVLADKNQLFLLT